MARRGERGAGDLFGVETVRDILRGVLAERQRAGDGFGREFVAEAGLVTGHALTPLLIAPENPRRFLLSSAPAPHRRMQ